MKKFVTNEIARRHGHAVLRSPVAHCELNPIELAWSQVQGYLRRHNTTFKLADLEQLVPASFAAVLPAMWEAFCRHTESEEERFWVSDGLQEEAVEDFIIQFNVDEDETDSEGEEDPTGLPESESDSSEDERDENDELLLIQDRVIDTS